MQTRLLTDAEFKATMTSPMQNVTKSATEVLDIWPYVDSVPITELEGHDIFDQFIEAVNRTGDEQFDHVLVMTKTQNVYLVVVIDLNNDCFYGHHLLDLNREYGLS